MGWGSWLRGSAGTGRKQGKDGVEALSEQAVLAVVAEGAAYARTFLLLVGPVG